MVWTYAKQGWHTARRRWFLLFLLFAYQYVWSFLLFKHVKSVVVPLLHRFPGEQLPASAGRLFWLESYFQLTRTDMLTPYLWTVGLFLLARMIATPLINGGLCAALADSSGESQRRAFFRGAKRYAKPFLLLYALQTLLTFAPLLWAVPAALKTAPAASDWTELAVSVAPYAIGWFTYQGLLKLLFLHIGLAIVDRQSGWSGLVLLLRRAIPAVSLSLLLFAAAAVTGAAVSAASLWWAGFAAVLLHQLYPLVRPVLKLWAISAQLHLRAASRSS